MRHVLAAAVAGLAFAAPLARAADNEPIHLEYGAFEGCPDQATFEAQARARSTKVAFVEAGAARTFEVRIDPGPRVTGRLVVHVGTRVGAAREVHVASCSEAVDALALMVALAVDPAALLAAAPAASTPAPAPTAPTEPVDPPPPASALVPVPAPVPVATPAPPAEAPRLVFVDRPAARTLYLGADVAMVAGASPGVMVGLAPYAGWRGARHGWVEPGLRLGVVRASAGEASSGGGTASFTSTTVRVDGCLLSWPGGTARLLACARVEGGVLEAAGSGVASARSDASAWAAVGPLLRFEWSAVQTLFLDADLAPMIHVTDDRFYFSPNATIYTVPVAGLEAAAGVGIHFL